jgi:hypothetical protein
MKIQWRNLLWVIVLILVAIFIAANATTAKGPKVSVSDSSISSYANNDKLSNDYVQEALPNVPMKLAGNSFSCNIKDGLGTQVEVGEVYTFGDLKAKIISRKYTGEGRHILVDLKGPNYEERGVLIENRKLVVKKICNQEVTLSYQEVTDGNPNWLMSVGCSLRVSVF